MYVRAKIEMVKGKHAPTFIRKFIQIARQTDNTTEIPPFDDDDKSLNEVLGHEDEAPVEADKLATWFRAIGFDRAGRLEFILRLTIHSNIYSFRGQIYEWAEKHGHWINFDGIKSEKVFPLGWLFRLHSHHLNRDALKCWIDKQDAT